MVADMHGRVVAVTGGARGQGEAHVRELVARGAEVYVCDVLDDAGRALAEALGGRATYLHLDVTEHDHWAAFAREVSNVHGGLQGLVNNAGVISKQGIGDFDVAEFRRVLEVNVLGVAMGMQACAPLMVEGGSIVNVSSIAAERVLPGLGAYTASKWAVKGMTKLAAEEFADRRIRVNAIMPGVISTAMVQDKNGDDTDAFRRNESRLVVKRLGQPADIAEAVCFLLSERSSYITGADLVIDGGWTLR